MNQNTDIRQKIAGVIETGLRANSITIGLAHMFIATLEESLAAINKKEAENEELKKENEELKKKKFSKETKIETERNKQKIK